MIAAYLTVPVYAAFHQWLGRGEIIAPMLAAWNSGDRKGALDAIPDELVDELVIHGALEHCRERVAEYHGTGLDTPVIAILPTPGLDLAEAVGKLAPPDRAGTVRRCGTAPRPGGSPCADCQRRGPRPRRGNDAQGFQKRREQVIDGASACPQPSRSMMSRKSHHDRNRQPGIGRRPRPSGCQQQQPVQQGAARARRGRTPPRSCAAATAPTNRPERGLALRRRTRRRLSAPARHHPAA